jgi:hypothetical protein
MKVKYLHGMKGICKSNIMWSGKFPMRGGVFPANHPCAGNAKPTVRSPYRHREAGKADWTDVPGETTAGETPLDKFRMRGYWASCFPEGDGITIDTGDRTAEQVRADIAECFGWEIEQEAQK